MIARKSNVHYEAFNLHDEESHTEQRAHTQFFTPGHNDVKSHK
jgi:hypothetical protein